MAGYSGTPLWKKLGFRNGDRVLVRRAPENYLKLLTGMPDTVKVSPRLRGSVDACHVFVRAERELAAELPALCERVFPDGTVWVSWPKKASGVATDMREDTVRSHALPLGLVDVKVCAVDDVWSGLKLVLRKSLRT